MSSQSLKTLLCGLLLVCGAHATAQGFQFNLDVLIDGSGQNQQSYDNNELYQTDDDDSYYEEEAPLYTEDDVFMADMKCQSRGYDFATGMRIDGERVDFYSDDQFGGRSYKEVFQIGHSNRTMTLWCADQGGGYEVPKFNFDFSLNLNQRPGRHDGGFPGVEQGNGMAPAVIIPNGPMTPIAPEILPGVDSNGNPLALPAGSTF